MKKKLSKKKQQKILLITSLLTLILVTLAILTTTPQTKQQINCIANNKQCTEQLLHTTNGETRYTAIIQDQIALEGITTITINEETNQVKCRYTITEEQTTINCPLPLITEEEATIKIQNEQLHLEATTKNLHH